MKISIASLPIITLIIVTLSSCNTTKKLPQTTTSLVDPETPTAAQPFIIDTTQSSNLKTWVLDFSDEFNDNVLDTKKWTIEHSTKKRVDVTLYSNNAQVEEKDGKAYIYYSKAATIHDSAYYVGRFTSQNKYAPIYGFIEARMHLVKPNGYQTAFWMMPNSGKSMNNTGPHDGTANDGAEIDIVEGNRLKSYSLGLHWDGYAKGTHKGTGSGKNKIANLYDIEYHVFGLEWTPTYLKFYCDGKLIKAITDPKAIPHVAEYIYFSGSCWGVSDWVDGDVRKNDFIQKGGVEKGYIDYVRVYKLKN